MRDRFRVVVFLLLTRYVDGRREVLLQKRQNTGIMDDEYFFCAGGHVRSGETLEGAMIREAAEEIGIEIHPQDLRIRAAVQIVEYQALALLFTVERYYGVPEIMEAEYASDLIWVDCDDLPEETNQYVKKALSDDALKQIISLS